MTDLPQHSIELLELRAKLQGSFLLFCQFFYKALNQRDFIISCPMGRESHFITCAKVLTKCARLDVLRLVLNLPPGCGKSTLLTMWVAWTLSMFPDARYMYISYSKKLAAKQTETIKRILSLREYKEIFDVHILFDSKAKEYFQTNQGGAVAAFGAEGSITGFDAGLPGLDRFSGAVVIDDSHKPSEVHSDTIREGVINNYRETIRQRTRGINVPIIFLGQRLHEADLPSFLLDGGDGSHWERVILKGLDEAGNALYPEAFPREMLETMRDIDPYVFAAQQQQDPLPAGGALFKPRYFSILPETPKMLITFITADTAETDKTYNDATVFSFWGLYKIETMGREINMLGLHWIDCLETRIEPKDMQETFLNFWGNCMRFKCPPSVAAIEKKSVGTTLISLLDDIRGVAIRNIERNRKSKIQRFLDIQPYVYEKRISFTEGDDHYDNCVTHMCKITANDSHRHDDIADTLADAVKIALMDQSIYNKDNQTSNIAQVLNQDFARKLNTYQDSHRALLRR